MSQPNSHRLWPVFLDAQNPNYKRPLAKIPTHPCDEKNGMSAWHFICLGIYDEDQVRRLLSETLEVDGTRLIDDLREHISRVPDPDFSKGWAKLKSLPNADCFDGLVGLGIEQLCRIQGLTLLGHYRHEGILSAPMHPVVMAYERWIEHELYGGVAPYKNNR